MPERTPLSLKRFLTEYFLPFLCLAAICVVNSLIIQKIFSVSPKRYLEWYVATGPFIGLALIAFGAAWDGMDKNVGLVSANPRTYIDACSKLAGLPIFALGGHLRSKHRDGVNLWDAFVGMPLIVVFMVASFAWLILIAPLQYFLFLVCGAPSRLALSSRYLLHAEVKDKKLIYTEMRPQDPNNKKAWEASMRDKPVTLANAFGTAVLFLIGYLSSR